MTCKPVQMPGGITAIVCGRGQRTKPCHYCGKPSKFMCDYPVIRKNVRGTCDVPLCPSCACEVAKDTDLCRAHFGVWQKNGCCFKFGDVEVR